MEKRGGITVMAEPIPTEIHTDHQTEIATTPETAKQYDRLILSNRLPVKFDGKTFTTTIGGMASAVRQAQNNGGNGHAHENVLWLGYVGDINEDEVEQGGLESALHSIAKGEPFDFEMVRIPRTEYDAYYGTVANGFLWPTAHSMTNRFMGEKVEHETYSQKYRPLPREKVEQAWTYYERANDRFAAQAVGKANDNTLVEIHDYHLLLAGEKMREKGFAGKISFFLHIPFPAPEVFAKTPHAQEIAKALLSCDVVGFQTEQDKNNFAAYIQNTAGVELERSPENSTKTYMLAKTPNKTVRIEAFPISIDPEEFRRLAIEDDVVHMADHIRETYQGKQIFFSGGRLDYSKGMVESLAAYYRLLEQSRLREKTVFVLATPLSRTEIPAYQKYAHQIERMLEMIYEKFGNHYYEQRADGTPRLKTYKELTMAEKEQQPVVHLGELNQKGMTAYYRAADAVVVASRADGMNLVAKEAVAVASTLPEGRTPVLLLSKGSGASHELTEALQFDTNWRAENIQQITNAMYEAATMPESERRRRMIENVQRVEANTIFDWAKARDDALRAA